MYKTNIARVATVAFVGLAGLTVPATAAMALPSGCSQSINAFGQLGGGELFAQLSGSCSTNAQRTLKGEIKRDISLLPDALTLEGADTDSRNYLVALQGCDNNRTATYYARVFFSGHTDYLDSDHKRYDVC